MKAGWVALTVAAAATLAVSACAVGLPVEHDLRPIALPDLYGLHPAVQQQARERYDALERERQDRTADRASLARAYGDLGMLLQAAERFDAAEPCYLNAQVLAPEDVRWPYYLAHVFKSRGQVDRAERAFARVLELQPRHLATLIWLGRLYLDKGEIDRAAPLFERAAGEAPRAVAVLAGQGQVHLARGRYAEAAAHFERALAADPESHSLHTPLARAYRGMGQEEKALPHLRRWENRDILVPDPLSQELDMLLESGLAYELRGVRALEAKDFESAAGYFRRGLDLTDAGTPLWRSLRHKLGTATYAAGEVDDAVRHFRAVVAAIPSGTLDESAAKAHYSLGVVAMANGQHAEGLAEFEAAVGAQPVYLEARLALAEALRRNGQVEASLTHYAEAATISPQSVQARWGYGLATVRLGRHRDAMQWLLESIAAHPERPEFPHLLARLLASSPDDRVRDGGRALELLKPLFNGPKTVELGETMAMALAEVGEYDQAAALQRGVLRTVRAAGMPDVMKRMETNLRHYEEGRPLRSVYLGDL